MKDGEGLEENWEISAREEQLSALFSNQTFNNNNKTIKHYASVFLVPSFSHYSRHDVTLTIKGSMGPSCARGITQTWAIEYNNVTKY